MSTPESVRLSFDPYPEQQQVLASDARFRVVAAGRRSGKTLMAAVETVRRALTSDGDFHAYWVGAEHRHADTAFRLIDSALPKDAKADVKRSNPREITLFNGAQLEFHTASGGALVSIGLDWVVCDEAAKDFPKRAWTGELRPALSDREGDAMFISTPDGHGWFHDAFQRGQNPDEADWASWQWATYANPHVPDKEIDDAQKELPDRVFRQEYLAEFDSDGGAVFSNLSERVFTGDWELPLDPLPESEQVDDPDAYAHPPFSTGVDFARHQDYRVTVTVDSQGRVVYFDRDQGEAWPQIQREVERVAATYPGVVSVDASRDNKIVADLEASGITIRPVKFSSKRKQQLIEDLVATVEAGDLTAPEIPVLKHEMEVFSYDVTRAGNVRYDAPEGFHDDTVDALALAADGLETATRQAASTTASIGGSDDTGGLGESPLGAAVREYQRGSGGNPWK